MSGLPPRSDDSYGSAANRGLYLPNVGGYFMRTLDSQPLSISTNLPTQVRGEVSPDPPPNTPSSLHHYPPRNKSLLFGVPTLCHYSSLPQTIAFPRACSRFNTHSVSGIEAV